MGGEKSSFYGNENVKVGVAVSENPGDGFCLHFGDLSETNNFRHS